MSLTQESASLPAPQRRPSTPWTWAAEISGALAATAAMLPFVLSFGLIVYGSAGAAAAPIGLTASVLAVVCGLVVAMPFGRVRLPALAPSASTSLILGALVVQLVRDPAFDAGSAAGAAQLVACTSAAVALAGLSMVALGLLRAGSLVRYVPQPVLAGFMNGVALLIVGSQLPTLFGVPADAWARDGLAALGGGSPLPFAVAALTTALAAAIAWRWPALPAPMVALVVATGAVWALQPALPEATAALARVGGIVTEWPRPDALAPWLSADAAAMLQRHGRAIVTTAALLTLIGSLETVLALASVAPQLDARPDPDRELRATGIANLVLGLFGGLFVVYLRLRAIAALGAGGRTPRAALLSSAAIALVFTLGLPLVREVPLAVVAGIVLMLAWTLVDRWTRRLLAQWWRGERSPELASSMIVVGAVCGVTLVWGSAAGVLAGVLVAVVIFVRALDRSVVRLRYRAGEIPSRRIYPQRIERQLAPLRERIEVFELEGALFFGSAHRLVAAAEACAAERGAALAHLVVDLRRVSTIDATGAVALAQLGERLAAHGVVLHLAGVDEHNRHGRALAAQGVPPRGGGREVHADADQAIEAAERALLAAAGVPPLGQAVPLQDNDLLAGIDVDGVRHLSRRLTERQLAAGERLFAEGDPGDAIYLLGEGSISIVDGAHRQRFVTFSPGMCFGETAVLDGLGRSAGALADMPSRVWRLSLDDLTALSHEHPALAARLHWNLARHLSQRLRAAAAAWRRAAT